MESCLLSYRNRISMASSFKTGESKITLINYYTNMLLMVEEGIRGGICHAICRYAKASNKCMKDYDQDKESMCNVLEAIFRRFSMG